MSFAVVGTEQHGIDALAVEHAVQGDVGDLRAVAGHCHPGDMIDIAGAFNMQRCIGRSHRDVLVAIDQIVVVVVQVACEERVFSVLENGLDRLEAVGRILPGGFMQAQEGSARIGVPRESIFNERDLRGVELERP